LGPLGFAERPASFGALGGGPSCRSPSPNLLGAGELEVDDGEEAALEAVLLGLPPSTEREAELALLL